MAPLDIAKSLIDPTFESVTLEREGLLVYSNDELLTKDHLWGSDTDLCEEISAATSCTVSIRTVAGVEIHRIG